MTTVAAAADTSDEDRYQLLQVAARLVPAGLPVPRLPARVLFIRLTALH
jgi:hypothetical protein